MALRSTNRRMVNLGETTTASGSYKLNVPIYTQSQSNWCWDACFQMVFAYFNFQISQCQIAQQVPWQTYGNCCGKPGCCNHAAQDSQINQGWKKWGYTFDYNFSQISYGSIVATINSIKVIEVGVTWRGGGGHVMLVIGYAATNNVYVNDPGGNQTQVISYSHLQSAYGQGVWDATWNDITS